MSRNTPDRRELSNMERALHSLWFEAQHYRNTGRGVDFLNLAIANAEKALIDSGAFPLTATTEGPQA